MSMSNARINKELQNTDSESEYPPKSRPVSQLEQAKEKYVVKKSDAADLEAYNSAICQFIAGPQYVPSLNAYFGHDGYESVASKKMANFVTNADDPLTLEDTEIESMKELIMRKRIIHVAKIALDEINADENEWNKRANLSSRLFDYIGLQSQNFAERRAEIEKIIADLNSPDVAVLYGQLQIYADTIRNRLANQLNLSPKHAKHLRAILNHMQNYQVEPIMYPAENRSIEDMEIVIEQCKNLNIDYRNMADGEYIDIFGNKILASDLRHYEYVKGLAISLTTRYLMIEGDMNNANFLKTAEWSTTA